MCRCSMTVHRDYDDNHQSESHYNRKRNSDNCFDCDIYHGHDSIYLGYNTTRLYFVQRQ